MELNVSKTKCCTLSDTAEASAVGWRRGSMLRRACSSVDFHFVEKLIVIVIKSCVCMPSFKLSDILPHDASD